MTRRVRWFGQGLLGLVLSVSLAACGTQSTTAESQTPLEPDKAVTERAVADSQSQQATEKPKAADTDAALAAKGKLVYMQVGCNTCHMNPQMGHMYPDLRGLYGSVRKLKDGTTVVADEQYLRESIVNPNKQLVAGYSPVMPPYNYLKEEQIQQLIAYIKSLKDEQPQYVKN